MERLLTIREVAELLGISVGAAYRWLSQGRLTCVRFSARCLRFRESDLAQLIEELARGHGCKSGLDSDQQRRLWKRERT